MKPNTQYSISVILTSRNSSKTIRDSIESVINQTIKPTELICIDGKSTDGTKEIILGYPEITYIEQEGLGIPQAYNQGIRATSGDYVAFLSSDDIWKEDKLKLQFEYLLAHPDHKAVFCNIEFFLENEDNLNRYPQNLSMINSNFKCMETFMMRRSLVQDIGYFDPRLKISEDVEYFARIFNNKIPYGFVDKILLNKRIHDDNSTQDVNSMRHHLLKSLHHVVRKKKERSISIK